MSNLGYVYVHIHLYGFAIPSLENGLRNSRVRNMTDEQPESKPQSEPTAGYISGLGNFIKELESEEKLIGALLVGILALLIIVIPSVPPEQRILVWFATVISVVVTFLVFRYWTKFSVAKLGKIKQEKDQLETKVESLRHDYSKLAISNNSRLSQIDRQIQQISESIHQLSTNHHVNDHEADALIQQLIRLAEDIQKQIEQNSDVGSRINAGTRIVANASEIAMRLAQKGN